MRHHRVPGLVVIVATIVFVCSGAAAAQIEQPRLTGVITDAQGGVLPDVTVTARSAALIGTHTAVTEADDRFRFPSMPGGN